VATDEFDNQAVEEIKVKLKRYSSGDARRRRRAPPGNAGRRLILRVDAYASTK
jgi:hypothetical protein